MKISTQSSLNKMQADAFQAGVDFAVRELLEKGLVLHEKKRDTGASMKIFADLGKADEVSAVVYELLASSDFPHADYKPTNFMCLVR